MSAALGWLAAAACLFAVLAIVPSPWSSQILWFLAGACSGAAAALWAARAGLGAGTGTLRKSLSGEAEPPAGPEGGAAAQAPGAEPKPDGPAGAEGSGDREQWADAKKADGIGYVKNKPAWFVRVVHPSRFREVDRDIEFKAFFFPTSALVAVLLRFFDNMSNPYCFHRVFDLSDASTLDYLKSVAADRRWTVVVNGRGSEEGFTREMVVDKDGLPKCLADGERHLAKLKVRDGPQAVGEFLKVFKTVSNKSGFHAGWDAVHESIRKQS